MRGDGFDEDLRRPPTEFDALIEWFDHLSRGLVLLEPCPLPDLREAIDRWVRELNRHLAAPTPRELSATLRSRIEKEHRRFRESVQELRGLLAVVEQEDHGGHRQALGQYGRLLAEALQEHRAVERRAVPSPRTAGTAGPRSSP